jgi:hypothetical protein
MQQEHGEGVVMLGLVGHSAFRVMVAFIARVVKKKRPLTIDTRCCKSSSLRRKILEERENQQIGPLYTEYTLPESSNHSISHKAAYKGSQSSRRLEVASTFETCSGPSPPTAGRVCWRISCGRISSNSSMAASSTGKVLHVALSGRLLLQLQLMMMKPCCSSRKIQILQVYN